MWISLTSSSGPVIPNNLQRQVETSDRLTFSESGHQLEDDLLQGVVQPETRERDKRYRTRSGRKNRWIPDQRRIPPQHLQWVGLMDLDATFRTVIALLKVLHDAALTDCKTQQFRKISSRWDQLRYDIQSHDATSLTYWTNPELWGLLTKRQL